MGSCSRVARIGDPRTHITGLMHRYNDASNRKHLPIAAPIAARGTSGSAAAATLVRDGATPWHRLAAKGEIASPARGTVVVSTVEATAVDLVGYMHRAGGVDRVAGVLSELGDEMDPKRLGYLLEHVGAGDRTVLLKADVRRRARNFTKLLPGASADDAPRSKEWRLFVNASIEADA